MSRRLGGGGGLGYRWGLGGVEGGCELGQRDVTRTLGPARPAARPPARTHARTLPSSRLTASQSNSMAGRVAVLGCTGRAYSRTCCGTEAAEAQTSAEDGPRPFQLADSRRMHAWAVLGARR